ncbi:hypothetical protein N7510_002077 [Penicillium lagena]|uniref:uncharacterized protein n=1 Tax=Penicillium lagena TaxID=94218 RepID=UPI002540E605|nr:uncharacterized protein N7510_002077 [Penicillium lagena]KAJ5625768.1 hypothetical protein N7510_002077 [Penicillium lagena]
MPLNSSLLDSEPKTFVRKHLQDHNLELTVDGQFVRWQRDNPKHPRNWTVRRKCYDMGLICLLDLFITATSTAGAAVASEARVEYGMSHTLSTFSFVTVFLLGQVVGSIVLPPWSESFGRKKLYIISGGFSSLCCMVIGLAPVLSVAIIMRVFAGMLSAIPYTIAGGSIEDMFNSQARIWVVFVWTVASNIGLIIGPIMSSYIISGLRWRWVFYIYATILGLIACLLCLIRESRPSFLLAREVKRLRANEPAIPPALNHDHSPSLYAFAKDALFRPAQLFFKEPIIFTIAVIIAIAFALVYIFTEALQPIYESMGFSSSQASLIFMAIGLGTCFSALTRVLDNHIFTLRRRKGQIVKPEDKLVGLAIGAPVLAIGLWWFGWTIPPKVHGPDAPWIVPTISLVFVGYALTELDTVLYGYISDSYLSYSASATAAVAFLRAMLSGTFPLFTRQMFDGLGANIAVSVLAAAATVFCVVPPLFICYGERIRGRSPFARYSLEIQEEMGKDEDDF